MAEKKTRRYVAAEDIGTEETTGKRKPAKPVGNASSLRTAAVILWIVAIAFEVAALFVYLGKLSLPFLSSLYQLIGFLVLDLVCVIIGSQLWKRANHIKPASKENKFKFWLWNNMGVVVCAFAFVPFIIILLSNKNTDKKTKSIALVVAIIALLIGGLASYDFNPVSLEEQTAAITQFGEEEVFWAPFGHVYHTHDDCQSLNKSDTLTYGTVEEAIEHNRTRLCKFCAKKDDITTVVTEE